LAVVPGEWSNHFKSPRRRQWIRIRLIGVRPIELQIDRQRAAMTMLVSIASEAHELLSRNSEIEAETTPVLEIVLDRNLHRALPGGIHGALCGHGSATCARCTVSILA
jgi:hypothetical protein